MQLRSNETCQSDMFTVQLLYKLKCSYQKKITKDCILKHSLIYRDHEVKVRPRRTDVYTLHIFKITIHENMADL